MPSKKQYDLVTNDDYDTRIPLHPDEAFTHGITFQAKYIGTLDVPKPQSRLEIVAAMRRIRYEFKAKGLKKKKVTIEISIEGVRVSLRKKKKKKQWLDESSLVVMQHPIYRIFYVSHDSQDLKIFSYIARDSSNVFKCSVFKSNKKSQAMRVVRTIGQAFDVCHKLSINSLDEDKRSEKEGTLEKKKKDSYADAISLSDMVKSTVDSSSSTLDAAGSVVTGSPIQQQRPLRLDLMPPPLMNSHQRKSPLGETYSSPMSENMDSSGRGGDGGPTPGGGTGSTNTPLAAHHELQLLREQLDQQTQQTQATVAQVHLLRDQLAAETAARLEAQTRIHQLLVQNKELLDHISALVQHLQEQERMHQQHQHQQQQTGNTVTAVPQHLLSELPSSGPLYYTDLGGYLPPPPPLTSSFYSLAPPPPPATLDYAQRLRNYYGSLPYHHSRSSSQSFPGTPILAHRAQTVEPVCRTPTAQQRRSRVEPDDDAFIRPLEEEEAVAMKAEAESQLRELRLQDSRPSFIQRSTSEKVPNRSELMSHVQRTVWARHTTK